MSFSCNIAGAEEILIDDFSAGLASGWQEKSFSGMTTYQVVREDGRSCLKAQSNGAASGLFYKIDYDPRQYPLLSWSWKIEHVLQHGDVRQKSGDDYPARIYVVFPSLLFWQTRALNYIWDNHLPKGEAVPNPYTSNTMMIAVESGSALAGEWVTEERNVYEDYKRVFGKEPPRVGAIAIMTDTDNTGETAVACYGPIRVVTRP